MSNEEEDFEEMATGEDFPDDEPTGDEPAPMPDEPEPEPDAPKFVTKEDALAEIERVQRSLTEKKPITVKLSTEERVEKGVNHARLCQKIEELEDRKKSITSQMKGEIDAEKAKSSAMNTVILTGEELRDVECRWHLNVPKVGIKRLVRDDTGETVDERDMELFDRESAKALELAQSFLEASEDE